MPQKGFQGDSFDWDAYVKHRPVYPRELYDLIYSYHAETKSSWNTAYDAGSGIGIVGLEHAKKFNHVILSDLGADYIADAKKFIADNSDASKFRFLVCKAEEDKGEIEHSSIDMMTMAECIHWTDVSQTLSTAAKLVRPGGTFAAWTYAIRPHLVNDLSGHTTLQTKLNKLFALYFTRLCDEVPQDEPALHTFQGLDTLDMDETKWHNVKRIHWRMADPDEALPPKMKGKRLDTHVRASEAVEKRGTDIIMREGVDIDWIKGYFDSLYPHPIANPEDYDEVEEALREVGGKVDLGWPMALVIATRR